jgi:hypothetical protein
MKRLFLTMPLLAMLTACSGGGGENSAQNAAPTQSAPAADAFTSSVSSMVETSSDTAEAIAIDGSAPSDPEDTEPTPLS